jgi:hypothetical protein
MSFQDYQEARKLHLMVAVVYNGGGLSPLLRLLRENNVSIVGLLQRLVADIKTAPPSVLAVYDSFVRLTTEELWETEDELREHVRAGNNYEKLLNGKIGINLIQTHTAMSLAVMDDWVEYIFRTGFNMLGDSLQGDAEGSAIFTDIQAFCAARVHNIWGNDRNEDNPCILLRYDIAGWMRSPVSTPVAQFKFSSPVSYQFAFPEAKQEEMAAQIRRYGTTTTGIGRIMAQMGRDRIWREAAAQP